MTRTNPNRPWALPAAMLQLAHDIDPCRRSGPPSVELQYVAAEELRARAECCRPGDASLTATPGDALNDGTLCYLQDTRQYVGNCPMWWAKGGNGYTTRLDEAEKYTLKDALRQHASRETDVPWPCAEIDPLVRPTVDVQHMKDRANQARKMQAALKENGNG